MKYLVILTIGLTSLVASLPAQAGDEFINCSTKNPDRDRFMCRNFDGTLMSRDRVDLTTRQDFDKAFGGESEIVKQRLWEIRKNSSFKEKSYAKKNLVDVEYHIAGTGFGKQGILPIYFKFTYDETNAFGKKRLEQKCLGLMHATFPQDHSIYSQLYLTNGYECKWPKAVVSETTQDNHIEQQLEEVVQ